MLRAILIILLASNASLAFCQLTLEECRQKARANYPLVRQYELIELTTKYTLRSVAKENLPQISLSGKVSYQSEVTEIPIQLPDVSIEPLSKDQYQIGIEIQQNLWDGGRVRNEKQHSKASADENSRQVDVDMYALNNRVDEVFFSILLLDEQIRQNELLEDQLGYNLQNVTAYRDNGMANDADIDAIQVEILNTRQQRVALQARRSAYLRMLALLIGEDLEKEISLEKPALPPSPQGNGLNRPELQLFASQNHSLNVREKSLQSGHMPQFSLFMQGVYGKPGLNILKNDFSPYYIVGIRLNWNFSSLYTLKNDKRKLETQRQQIQTQKDLFLFNTHLQLAEEEGEITALRQQMRSDDEIIRLRTNIRRAAEAKVANGSLSVTEMLEEVVRESMAKQDKALHEIQLLMNIYQQKHLLNE